MGQFLEAMDKKWGKNPEVAAQYMAMRRDLEKIDKLEASLRAVMEQVYLPMQREYEKTTYGAFLNAQVGLDKEGPTKAARIEHDVKEKVKNYWQTIAISLQHVNASNRDAVLDGEPIRSIMRAFIPGELDNMEARKKIIELAKQYAQNPNSEEADKIVQDVQNIAWQSINKAHLMLVIEAGVGGEIASAKGLSSKGSARAGGCDAAGDKLKSEFKNLPEVDRLSCASEGMSLILAALTSIKQLRDENDIDRLEGFAPTVSANVDSVVNGNEGNVPGQKQGGMLNMLNKLYKLEMLECLLTLDHRKKTLVNADLRKEIVEDIFKIITQNVNQANLVGMISYRTVALSVVRDCENANLSIEEILGTYSLPNKAAIASKVLSPFKYYIREAFPELNTSLSIGIPNKSKEPITIAQAIEDMDKALVTNREQILKRHTNLKQAGEPLGSTFGYLMTVLNAKKSGFSHVITMVAGDKTTALSSMSIAAVIEHSIGFIVPMDETALQVWKAIENDLNLKNDPLVIELKALRDMIDLTMKFQSKARALVGYLEIQSKSKVDVSVAVALEFGKCYNDMVYVYPDHLTKLNHQYYANLSALKSIRTQSHIAQRVSSDALVYQPKGEITRNLQELQGMNSGKILLPEKILAMKLALALHEFAIDESDAFQSFANTILIELKTCTELKPIADRIQDEVDRLEKNDRSVDFFAGVKSMVGFTRSQADLTPREKLMSTVAAINHANKSAVAPKK